MAKPQSVFLVALLLGIVLGAVGVAAVTPKLSPTARDVANSVEDPAPKPQHYGNR